VQTTAVLSASFPGLFFLIAVATPPARRRSRAPCARATVNAVESVAGVDVGVHRQDRHLTTGQLTLDAIVRSATGTSRGDDGARRAGTRSGPGTSPRPRGHATLPAGQAWSVRDGALLVAALVGLVTDRWVLGAPDHSPHLRVPPPTTRSATRRPRSAGSAAPWADPTPSARPDGHPAAELQPVALVALADEAARRPPRYHRALRWRGSDQKGPLGDDPRTVAALATRAGIDVTGPRRPPP
jgi:cation-transporting ATPase E